MIAGIIYSVVYGFSFDSTALVHKQFETLGVLDFGY